jgi:ABC-type Fe3+-hydroxamate transport system substrate-binding protein
MTKIMGILLFLVGVGCGSSNSAPNSTSTSTTTSTSGEPTLKLESYLSWCSVSVNGGAASTDATQTLTVASGTMVPLSATPASSVFVWGYWVGTDGDTGASHDTAQAATVTMDKSKVVQACCPFASDPSTPCPAPTP